MIELDTALGIAQREADKESGHLYAHESFVVAQRHCDEYSWGWVFEPVIEPYASNNDLSPRGGAWCISVDRFNGKVQTAAWSWYSAEIWPVVELWITDPGDNNVSVYQSLRELNGWTAIETRNNMRKRPLLVYSASMTVIDSIALALKECGASVSVRQQHQS